MIRILYIDDSADDREIVRFNVSRISEEIQIESAASAQEAIHSISRDKPDCIVSDLDMPGMNGLELLRTLRNSGNRTPFIFFSCHDYTDLRELAILAGAQAFEVKGLGKAPVARLVETIKQAVEDEREAARRLATRGEPGSLALSTWT